jgi:hypothetical protein
LTRTILVVDDSRTIRQQTRVLLESHGFKVIEAGNGVEGLEEAKKGPVDLIIVDVNMPAMNGLEMIGLRQDPHLRAHHRGLGRDRPPRQGRGRHRLGGQAVQGGGPHPGHPLGPQGLIVIGPRTRGAR